MSLIMSAGSMPVWSYWFWGMVGIFMLIMFVPTFKMKDRVTGKIIYFWEELIPIAIGLFLVFYWLNKIGIVPMYPWQLEHWFYGWQ